MNGFLLETRSADSREAQRPIHFPVIVLHLPCGYRFVLENL